MLCSRFSFRLSVRQVVSRVILRGSALHYFAQRPIWAHTVDGLFPQRIGDLFGILTPPTQKENRIAVVRNDFVRILDVYKRQVVQVAQVFKDGGPRFRLGQLIADVLKGCLLYTSSPNRTILHRSRRSHCPHPGG